MRPAFEVVATDQSARAGVLRLRSGTVRTPVFMPVATRGMVRLVPPATLGELGAELVLANTYHLALRPGVEVIEALGGVARFSGIHGPMLTDSGGFQVMSLGARVDDDGVSFRSTYDGQLVRFEPESVVELQERFRVDVAMVLDVCTTLPAPRSAVEEAMRRTSAWARRAKRAHRDHEQALFGIVQGGIDTDLRRAHASDLVTLDFDGYAVGGLAVGEEASATLEAVAAALEELPRDRPRYLMGVGDPYLVAHAVALGVDMVDCVAPTRLARHGIALTDGGRLALRAARFRRDEEPIESGCDCATCRRVPRALVSHLLRVDAPSAGALLSVHNLAFQLRFLGRLRRAIQGGELARVVREVSEVWGPGWRAPTNAALRER